MEFLWVPPKCCCSRWLLNGREIKSCASLKRGVKNQSIALVARRLIIKIYFFSFESEISWLHIFFWSSSSNAMKGIFNAFFQRAKQCMKWMGKMQFRCIIRQFTYLNSFFGIPLFPWFCVRLPFLSYRLIFFQLEVLCRCSFRLVRQAREIQNSKKKPRKKKI